MMCGRILAAAVVALVSWGAHAQDRAARELTAKADTRAPIALSDIERAFIKTEMRGLLAAIQDILDAAPEGDRARVIAAGRRVGMNGPEKDHIPKSLAAKLPTEFKQLGLATHRAFDRIAQDAEGGGALDRAPRQIGELMRNCIACHGTWRVVGDGGR
jgi:hypothetical protein